MESPAAEHEAVVFRRDVETGLRAVIAIHDTRLGPAAGGCRCWHYATENEALADALRLSRGMTYKNALADIPFGGGKSVIMGEAGKRPSEAQLRRFGCWIDELGGCYITAEDVGMRVADMRIIAWETAYVSGLGQSGIGGDPSPATAEGVHHGLKAAVRRRLGVSSLRGVRIAVQGLGNVGFHLARRLSEEGAHLVVADLDPERVSRAVSEFGAVAVAADAIAEQDVEVFAPCALGGVLSEESVERLRASVVAGSANNQLLTPEVAGMLADKGVLYAPDYVINAGGVISIAAEYLRLDGHHGAAWITERLEGIPTRLETIFVEADRSGNTTDQVAERMAHRILESGGGSQKMAVNAL